MTLPHSWPALMSAASTRRSLRRNYVFAADVLELCLLLPMIIGFAALLVLQQAATQRRLC